jgi:hypothetical protein
LAQSTSAKKTARVATFNRHWNDPTFALSPMSDTVLTIDAGNGDCHALDFPQMQRAHFQPSCG